MGRCGFRPFALEDDPPPVSARVGILMVSPLSTSVKPALLSLCHHVLLSF
jgi:hypothetical protein